MVILKFSVVCLLMQIIFWLLAFLLAFGAAFWVYRADKRRAVPKPWLTALLRGLVVLGTLILILIPSVLHKKQYTEQPVIVWLQDNTASIAANLGADTQQYQQDAAQLLQRLEKDYKVVKWGFGARTQPDTLFQYTQPLTDVSNAIASAQEYYGMQNLGAVVVATDGKFNTGSHPQFQQFSSQCALYTLALGDSAITKDLKVARTYANKSVTINNAFEIRADILAHLANGYNNNITLTEEGAPLGSLPIVIHADRYDRSVSFTVSATKAGLHHYVLTLPPVSDEANVANNKKDIYVEVVAQKKNILIASSAPHPDVNAIRDALQGIESYKVYISTEDKLPESFEGYDAVILHGLPSVRSVGLIERLKLHPKPMLLILSATTNIAAVNAMSEVTQTTMAAAPVHEVLLHLNPRFNTFTLPTAINGVMDKMPPLQVYVSNIMAPPGTNALCMQSTGVGSAQSALWLMQQGTVPIAIIAGDGLWRWRLYEYKNFNTHEVVDELIRQTVGFVTANAKEQPFTVALPKYIWSDQEPITLKAYLLNDNKEQINTADVHLKITDSAGTPHDYTFEKSGNSYFLNIGIWAGGSYKYSAQTSYNGKDYTSYGSFTIESTPLELMETGADYPLLFNLAKKYNGAFFTRSNMAQLADSIKANTHIKPLLQETNEVVPFIDAKWFFFIILLIVVAEWLLRKYWSAQ